MNKLANFIGWGMLVILALWLFLYVITTLVVTVNDTFSDRTYYWECRIKARNPLAPWPQFESNKAQNPAGCQDKLP